jgi:hypothetical protein
MDKKEWKELFKRFTLEDLLETVEIKDIEKDEGIQELLKWLMDDSSFKKSKIKNMIDKFDINAV